MEQPEASDTGASSEWRQHWTVLIPSIAGVILCAVHSYSLGVVIAPLEQEFGWSRAQITVGPLIISFIAVAAAPFVGLAIDRFGPRRIALFGIVLFCATLAFASTATANVFSWWFRWALLGFGNMFVLPVIWTTAVNSLFHKNRGMALAIALSGTGITAAVVPSLTQYLVDQGGWRFAYLGLAAIFLAVVMPVTIFLFRGATDRIVARHGVTPISEDIDVVPGLAPGAGIRSATFLKLGTAVFVFTIAGSGLTANSVPILRSQGFDGSAAAALAGLIGIGSIAGRLLGGYLLDRFEAKLVAAISVGTPVLAILLLLWLPGSLPVAALSCVIIGLSVGTEIDAAAYLAARHFGLRSFGTIFGTINGLILFANGLAPISANYIYDLTKSYDGALWAWIPVSLMASALFLSMGRYPDFDRKHEIGRH